MPTFKITNPDTGKALSITGDSFPDEAEIEAIFSQQQNQQPESKPTDNKLGSIGSAVLEFGHAFNRGLVDLADYLTTDQINIILNTFGSDTRVPGLGDIDAVKDITRGNIMEPGMARDIVQAGGELAMPGAIVGQGIRQTAKILPKIANAAEPIINRTLRSMAGGTVASDAVLSAVSGGGQVVGKELGGDTGEVIGAIMAPVGAIGAQKAIGAAINAGKQGIQALFNPLAKLSDDGASTLLAEAMVREGLSPDDVTKRLAELGPEALPADIGNSFARLLRLAGNKIPRIEGDAAIALNKRQAGQGERILKGFDQAAGRQSLSVDDEIVRLNEFYGPEIKKLYEQAGAESIVISPKLKNIMEGDNTIGRSQNKVKRRLADRRAVGDKISNIDLIDETKRELDDQIGKAIRQGESNQARNLVRLKNTMIEEADAQIPVYKHARDLFAGKAALENATEAGELFFKMKSRDVTDLVKNYSRSEKRMYQIGAKQAILDKIDTMQITANGVKRMFGKGGDIKKLQALFDSPEEFKRFSDTLKTEADFTLTRQAAQGNSTTKKQFDDDESAYEKLSSVAEAISNPASAMKFIDKTVRGLGRKRGSDVFVKSLEDAGDILLLKGMEPEKLQNLLKRGARKALEARLTELTKKQITKPLAAAQFTGAVEATTPP